MENRFAIVLVAGQGTRMKSKLKKELHPILDRPMIDYVLDALEPTNVDTLVSVVGHAADEVKAQVGNRSEYVTQKEQLGTAHAVQQAKELLQNKQGTTIVVCGDTPLITSETYDQLFAYHEQSESKATILTTRVEDPFGYGRVIRNRHDEVEKIVEHKDANDAEKAINEINTGTYCFDNQALFAVLNEVGNDNAQGEYYLPDVIEILKRQDEKVSAFAAEDPEETIGINDRVALAKAAGIMKRRLNEMHLRNGVSVVDPANTYIGSEVTIESDVIIQPGCIISGNTHIASGSNIGPHTEIDSCQVGENTVIRQSVVNNSKIGYEVIIGPYAHIRPDTLLGNQVRVGNFVELKKVSIGEMTKVPHLSYLGDATLGKGINVGCGTITVNYDGVDKHQTTIKDNAFVGCNANLIAPVTIEEGAFVAAGSTITKDVPADGLGIARGRQENKDGYAAKLKKKK